MLKQRSTTTKKCGKRSELQKSEHRNSKRTSKINQRIRASKVSIKVIRMSKDQNEDNYLWHITYGYQGLWGVRLGSVRFG